MKFLEELDDVSFLLSEFLKKTVKLQQVLQSCGEEINCICEIFKSSKEENEDKKKRKKEDIEIYQKKKKMKYIGNESSNKIDFNDISGTSTKVNEIQSKGAKKFVPLENLLHLSMARRKNSRGKIDYQVSVVTSEKNGEENDFSADKIFSKKDEVVISCASVNSVPEKGHDKYSYKESTIKEKNKEAHHLMDRIDIDAVASVIKDILAEISSNIDESANTKRTDVLIETSPKKEKIENTVSNDLVIEVNESEAIMSRDIIVDKSDSIRAKITVLSSEEINDKSETICDIANKQAIKEEIIECEISQSTKKDASIESKQINQSKSLFKQSSSIVDKIDSIRTKITASSSAESSDKTETICDIANEHAIREEIIECELIQSTEIDASIESNQINQSKSLFKQEPVEAPPEQNICKCQLDFYDLHNQLINQTIADEKLKEKDIQAEMKSVRSVHYHKKKRLDLMNERIRQNEWCCGYLHMYSLSHLLLVEKELCSLFGENTIPEALDTILKTNSWLNVVSVGGGPGNDLIGFCSALYGRHHNLRCLDLTVVDLMSAWSGIFSRMMLAVREKDFGNVSKLFREVEVSTKFIESDMTDYMNLDTKAIRAINKAEIVMMVKTLSIFSISEKYKFVANVVLLMRPKTLLICVDYPSLIKILNAVPNCTTVLFDSEIKRHVLPTVADRFQSSAITKSWCNVHVIQKV